MVGLILVQLVSFGIFLLGLKSCQDYPPSALTSITHLQKLIEVTILKNLILYLEYIASSTNENVFGT